MELCEVDGVDDGMLPWGREATRRTMREGAPWGGPGENDWVCKRAATSSRAVARDWKRRPVGRVIWLNLPEGQA